MELQPRKIAAVAALIVMLLLTVGDRGLQASAGNNGDVCSVVGRSKTFKGGVCMSKSPCVAACRGEGYPDGYCFLDVPAPDHRVCMCTGPCSSSPPETARSPPRRLDMVQE